MRGDAKMKEPTDRLGMEKERIKFELQKLDERRKELNRKTKGLKVYKTYLEKILGKVERVTSVTRLDEIVKKSKLQTQVKPSFFKLSKYLIRKELAQKLEETKQELEGARHEIEDIASRKNNANTCPECGGKGQLKELYYAREDGIVRPELRITSCSLCGGEGAINYSDT
jgi:DnaJ-class molecular chaperone